MDPKRQDIYESDSSKRNSARKSDQHSSYGNNAWLDRHSKRAAAVFRLIILAFIIFISLFLIEQRQSRRRDYGSSEGPARVEYVGLRSGSVFDFGNDFETELILDEMAAMEPAPIRDGDAEIEPNIHWVKQAAMHLIRAERAYASEEWGLAVEHYNSAQKILPDLKGVDAKLGLCYMRMQDYGASADAFGKASPGNTNAFRVLNNIGVARLANKEFSEAQKSFGEVLKIEPDYGPALYNMALLHYRTQMYAEAADYFDRYFSVNAADIEAIQVYTDVLIKLERWEDASETLAQSSRQLPHAAPIYMTLAYVLTKTGELDAAMDNLNRGIRLLDRPRAMAMVTAPEYNALRQRQDFKELVDRITSE